MVDDGDIAAEQDEQNYVHAVYEDIAHHFSQTRYKPWSLVSKFLSKIPAGSLGIDGGCGNGKYLGIQSVLDSSAAAKSTATTILPKNANTNEVEGKRTQEEQEQGERGAPQLLIGFDRSSNLAKIAHDRGHEVFVSDCLYSPWRYGIFDYAISIATIHHLSTWNRRKSAVKVLLQAVSSSHGRVLIQVWAAEQEDENALTRRKYLEPAKLSSNNDCPDNNNDNITSSLPPQDVFVPWKTLSNQPKQQQSSASISPSTTDEKSDSKDHTFLRYYHLFQKGELEKLVNEAASDLGYKGIKEDSEYSTNDNTTVFKVLNKGWERGNWWIEAGLGLNLESFCN